MNGYQLLEQFSIIIKDAILVPNSWLPEKFQDHRTDSVSLADLDKKCDGTMTVYDYGSVAEETDHQEEKREKARRVELYASMVAEGKEIVYLTKGS